MFLITKHITRFNGLHSDIILGYVEKKEEAQECIDQLNKAAQGHDEDVTDGIGQYLYKKLEKFEVNPKNNN